MNFIYKLKRFLTSPKTVICLIIITLIACLIGFFVPQIGDKSPSYFELWKEKNLYTYRIVDRLQLNRVYTSFWFLTLVVLITASLGYSLYLQVKRNLRQNREHKTQKNEYKTFDHLDEIVRIFKKRRLRLSGIYSYMTSNPDTKGPSDGHRLIFTKNSIGRWGGVIFHFGLLLVIISAILILCLQKRGFIQLIEGDLFDGKEINFLVKNKGLFAGEFDTGFQVHLSKLDHTYWEGGKIRSLESSIEVIKETETIHNKLSINNPLFIEGTNIYQSSDYGYTLSFVMKRPSGEEILSHFNINRTANVQKPAIGKSDFPMTNYIFKMKFLPDISNKSFYLTKPILYLTAYEGSSIVFNGLVIPNDAVKIKEDILHFLGVRYWSGLIFVNNPGIFIAYIGFVIGILGTGIMFLLPYKEVYLISYADRGAYDISGLTKRYQALFKEELSEIRKELGIIKNG